MYSFTVNTCNSVQLFLLLFVPSVPSTPGVLGYRQLSILSHQSFPQRADTGGESVEVKL